MHPRRPETHGELTIDAGGLHHAPRLNGYARDIDPDSCILGVGLHGGTGQHKPLVDLARIDKQACLPQRVCPPRSWLGCPATQHVRGTCRVTLCLQRLCKPRARRIGDDRFKRRRGTSGQQHEPNAGQPSETGRTAASCHGVTARKVPTDRWPDA